VACQLLFWPQSTTTLQSMNETGCLQLISTPCKCHDSVLVDSWHCRAEQLHGYDKSTRYEDQHRKSWYLQCNSGCPLHIEYQTLPTRQCFDVLFLRWLADTNASSQAFCSTLNTNFGYYMVWQTISQVISFMLWPIYPIQRRPTLYLNSNLYGPQGQSTCGKGEKDTSTCQGSNPGHRAGMQPLYLLNHSVTGWYAPKLNWPYKC
jgi:hypothetical protein